ncbi:substrate-binding domain-containing protein [bacterium]|nr:substrate-binding domain-containing protein [bacterium]
MLLTLAAGCGKTSESTAIYVVSREEGSGTRGAFIELFGIEQKNEAGEKIDHTVETAEVTDSTSVMMQTIAGNKAAIGYISLGSLNDTVKALQIDGMDATAENVKNGTYKIARPFNVATLANVSPEAQDFLNFILSAEGQAVVEKANCISEGNTGAFTGGSVSGKIVVAGSSSVTPVMEKLKEAYNAINPNLTIDIQQSDSSNGMKSAIEGLCDIGMASRDLKDSELEAGLTPTAIALDGIAVIVNTESERSGLTSDQVRAIFMGELTDWSEVK